MREELVPDRITFLPRIAGLQVEDYQFQSPLGPSSRRMAALPGVISIHSAPWPVAACPKRAKKDLLTPIATPPRMLGVV